MIERTMAVDPVVVVSPITKDRSILTIFTGKRPRAGWGPTEGAGLPASHALDAEDPPLTRHTLELTRAHVAKANTRSGDEVLHRAGGEDLTGIGQGCDPGADVHG